MCRVYRVERPGSLRDKVGSLGHKLQTLNPKSWTRNPALFRCKVGGSGIWVSGTSADLHCPSLGSRLQGLGLRVSSFGASLSLHTIPQTERTPPSPITRLINKLIIRGGGSTPSFLLPQGKSLKSYMFILPRKLTSTPFKKTAILVGLWG